MHDYPIETLARTQRADRLVAAIETVIAGDDLLVITKNYEAAAVVISHAAYEELRDAYVMQAIR